MKKSKLFLSFALLAAVLMPVGCGNKSYPQVSSSEPVVSQSSEEKSEDYSTVISEESVESMTSSESLASSVSEESVSIESSSDIAEIKQVKYDFTALAGSHSTSSLTADNIAEVFANVTGTNLITSYADIASVYDGNGKGGAKDGQNGMLKFGTKDKQGTITLNTSENVSKVDVEFHSFYAKSSKYPNNTSNYLSVNGEVKVAPYNETGAPEVVSYELTTPSTSVTLKSCDAAGTGAGRICVYSITLYY